MSATMLTRRMFLKTIGLGALASFALGSYAFALEPRFRLAVTRYRFTPPRWPATAEPFRIAVIADIHACDPWMPLSRIEEIVATTNGLKPDVTVLLGDYVAGLKRFRTAIVPSADWARALGQLRAPLGVHAILGNHDWWTDPDRVRKVLGDNNIPVMENDVALLRRGDGLSVWLAGLGDQLAIPRGRGHFDGVDDLPGTLARIPQDGKPIVLLAHEPDIFAVAPERVSLTLSGHTHGGQVALPFFGRPIVPSSYGERYAYGHIVENGRHLVVSGGLGCSTLPVRFGVPPEVVLLEVGGNAVTA
jgi:predicted MPP superfamily phosphohydrolase